MGDELIIILISVGAILAGLLAVVLVRTLMFKPKKVQQDKVAPVYVNSEKATADLAEMIRCKTVSNTDKSLEDEGEFEKFERLLPTLFPNVHARCIFEKVGDRALLYRWKGKSAAAPTVLMSHYDVVSVVEENWQKPAFDGLVENGILWGRGTLDTKGTLNAVMQAAEMLIEEGYIPENDIYFAFGGDEEVNGHGASDIVKLFTERKITPGLVLDEGGAVVERVFPDVSRPCALIGIAEKGMLNVEYSVTGGGGHSSTPAPRGPVYRLARACKRLEDKPFKFRTNTPAKEMFNVLARHSNFLYRMLFSNLWLFTPVLNLYTRLVGGDLNAMLRTTTAFTQMEGSKGINVIPPYARMASNHRIAPGDTVEGCLERIKRVVGDDKVEVKLINGTDPSRISEIGCRAWDVVREATGETWQEAIVSPYLMLACSDSRHWGEVSDKVYRFSAMALSKEERATIHGNDERIPVSTIAKSVEFYVRLMKKI